MFGESIYRIDRSSACIAAPFVSNGTRRGLVLNENGSVMQVFYPEPESEMARRPGAAKHLISNIGWVYGEFVEEVSTSMRLDHGLEVEYSTLKGELSLKFEISIFLNGFLGGGCSIFSRNYT